MVTMHYKNDLMH